MKGFLIGFALLLPFAASAENVDLKAGLSKCFLTLWEADTLKPLARFFGPNATHPIPAEIKTANKKATPQEQKALVTYLDGLEYCNKHDLLTGQTPAADPEYDPLVAESKSIHKIAVMRMASGRSTWAEYYESTESKNMEVLAKMTAIYERRLREAHEARAAEVEAQRREEQRQAIVREQQELLRQQLAQQAAAEKERNQILREQARQANIDNALNNLIKATQPRFVPMAPPPVSIDCQSRSWGGTTYTNCR